MVNIFNLFITYGDTFLPSPTSYDELYYEIIRVHQIFDNLYSMGESDKLVFDETLSPRSRSVIRECNHSTFDGENSILITLVFRDSSGVSDWLILECENLNPSSNQSGATHGLLLSYVIRMDSFWSRLTCDGRVQKIYWLLTKCEVKMAGFCVFMGRDGIEVHKHAKRRIIWLSGISFLRIRRVVPSWQDSSILPARVANHSAGFDSSWLAV